MGGVIVNALSLLADRSIATGHFFPSNGKAGTAAKARLKTALRAE
jgi:hypothetical protein